MSRAPSASKSMKAHPLPMVCRMLSGRLPGMVHTWSRPASAARSANRSAGGAGAGGRDSFLHPGSASSAAAERLALIQELLHLLPECFRMLVRFCLPGANPPDPLVLLPRLVRFAGDLIKPRQLPAPRYIHT